MTPAKDEACRNKDSSSIGTRRKASEPHGQGDSPLVHHCKATCGSREAHLIWGIRYWPKSGALGSRGCDAIAACASTMTGDEQIGAALVPVTEQMAAMM